MPIFCYKIYGLLFLLDNLTAQILIVNNMLNQVMKINFQIGITPVGIY